MAGVVKDKSILTDHMDYCIICNKPKAATHHLLSGIANRHLSDKDQVIAPLCYDHHTGKHGIHTIREVEVLGKIIGQIAWEKNHIMNLLIDLIIKNKGLKGDEAKVFRKEEWHRINDEAREAFRDRYSKSFL